MTTRACWFGGLTCDSWLISQAIPRNQAFWAFGVAYIVEATDGEEEAVLELSALVRAASPSWLPTEVLQRPRVPAGAAPTSVRSVATEESRL